MLVLQPLAYLKELLSIDRDSFNQSSYVTQIRHFASKSTQGSDYANLFASVTTALLLVGTIPAIPAIIAILAITAIAAVSLN